MKVALSVPGKFHSFDLARELHAQGMLAGVLSAYPMFKLRNEGLPGHLIQTFPWLLAPYMARPSGPWLPRRLLREWEECIATTFARWASRRLPECDVYVGLSGTSLLAGRLQRERGGRYVCDRGSAHIRVQDRLLREEHATWGLPFEGIDPRAIERDEVEYGLADRITVPSDFARRSFIDQGVPPAKLHLLPYGVNLSRFHPVGKPDQDGFTVLYIGALSLQKGIPYLLQAFARLKHPRKRLLLAGSASAPVVERMRQLGLWPSQVQALGHVPQPELKSLISRSHVLVLPSVQDGFGMVMAQAMACGCPVVASEHTGARELLSDGVEGFIVPVRDAEALAERLELLVESPDLRERMSQAALQRVQQLGGWRDYGTQAMNLFRDLVAK